MAIFVGDVAGISGKDAGSEVMASFKWLTVRDVARKLDVHEETVRRWIRRGDLIALDLGGPRAGYRIRPADLDAFVRGGSGSTSGQPQSLDAGR